MSCSNESVYGSRFDQIQVLDKPVEDVALSNVPQEWIEAADITENMVGQHMQGTHLWNLVLIHFTSVL